MMEVRADFTRLGSAAGRAPSRPAAGSDSEKAQGTDTWVPSSHETKKGEPRKVGRFFTRPALGISRGTPNSTDLEGCEEATGGVPVGCISWLGLACANTLSSGLRAQRRSLLPHVSVPLLSRSWSRTSHASTPCFRVRQQPSSEAF